MSFGFSGLNDYHILFPVGSQTLLWTLLVHKSYNANLTNSWANDTSLFSPQVASIKNTLAWKLVLSSYISKASVKNQMEFQQTFRDLGAVRWNSGCSFEVIAAPFLSAADRLHRSPRKLNFFPLGGEMRKECLCFSFLHRIMHIYFISWEADRFGLCFQRARWLHRKDNNTRDIFSFSDPEVKSACKL